MKLYRKRFLLIVALAFFTICAWTIFSRNVSEGLKYASPSPNGNRSSSNFHQAPASAAVTAAAIVAAKDDHHHQQQQQLQKVRNIVCNINGEYKVNCLKLMVAANSVSATKPESSVYVPFSLIHKYFEINGKVVATGPAKSGTTSEYFEWSHSYSKIFYPDEPYSSRGRFLWFANYNVEVRERVKCVSAAEAVPVSTQWYAKGHFYPTQIAQYGLSHFSKNLTEAAPQAFSLIEWPGGRLAGNVTSRPRLPAPAEGEDHLVISENTTLYLPESDGHHLGRDMTSFLVLDLTLQLPQDSHCSISVVIADSSDGKDGEEESLLVLQYSTAVTAHLRRGSPQYRMAVYGLGSEEKSDSTKNVSAEWRPFTRDLLVDLYKGNLISSGRRSRPNRSLRVVRIELAGRMAIGRRAALLTSAHGHFALAAGDWLVRRQNAHDGWDIKVKRRLQSKSALGGGGNAQPPPPPPPPLVLAEGWHSAMAQGQAISLLARLYAHTGRPAYLAAAKRALALFEVEAFRGGVRARFLDRHVWYEEYPTVPSIFVLNGFIYSLFGLYDLGQICGGGNGGDQAAVKTEDDPACLKAASLFEEGIRSLEAMLPLFDSGSGSFYDLRHQALATVAPNVARWDYHSTHINQLLALHTVVRRDVFQATADRWIAYMRGHRAAHN